MPRLPRALLLLVPPLTAGCLGSMIVDELLAEHDTHRAGMIVIAEDSAFSVHARPGMIGDADAFEVLRALNQLLGEYVTQTGLRPARRIGVYLHAPGDLGDELIAVMGVAWCSDLSFDAELNSVESHELAHVVLCGRPDRLPGEMIGRTFLEEGMAEYLSRTTEDRLRGWPATVAGDLSEACSSSWSLHEAFLPSRWLAGDTAYNVAALFTELAVRRLGLARYLSDYLWPSSYGTTAEAEQRLIELTGLDFAHMEREMRRAGSEAWPRPCGGGAGCDDLCQCRASSNGGTCVLAEDSR